MISDFGFRISDCRSAGTGLLLFVLAVLSGCSHTGQQQTSTSPTPATKPNAGLPFRLTKIVGQHDQTIQGIWYISAKVEETGGSAVVGMSWQLESGIRADGSTAQVSDDWHAADPDELPYGKPSLKVTNIRLCPAHPSGSVYTSVKVRIRAAVAERIESIRIPNFQLGQEYKVSEHGYVLTTNGWAGTHGGDEPATMINVKIQTPSDYITAANDRIKANWRLGFQGEDRRLITPAGASIDQWVFLGRDWTGKTLVFEVPVGIRLVETTIDVPLSGAAAVKQ